MTCTVSQEMGMLFRVVLEGESSSATVFNSAGGEEERNNGFHKENILKNLR
jgi:hypothetical protein